MTGVAVRPTPVAASADAPATAWPAAVAETHCATVVFIGDRAYKMKKPVDLGFLDFSTVASRKDACLREVELNRRLAPDVYLGVADVTGPDGEVCDHLVVMRRMPEGRRLSDVLARGEGATAVREIARKIAVLHARSATSASDPAIAAVATREAVAANWADNVDVLGQFTGDVLDADEVAEVEAMATRYLAGRNELFSQRIREGLVRDGHGDLQAQDIFCLDDGPRILDCLEFADRYRYGDVLVDVAFLAMDLERLGHPQMAARFMGWYAQFSGEQHPATLAHHYIAYRAHVRAKVACLRHAQGDPRAAGEARLLHRVARDHLRQGRVAMVLVGGLPGTGKSTLATGLSDSLGWALLSTDEIRKDLMGMGHSDDAHAAYGEGIYRPELVAAVYDELLGRAGRLLRLGVPVVLDASWSAAAARETAAAVARATCSDLVQLRTETSAEVARARLLNRPPGSGPSDATPEARDAMAAHADPWPEAVTVRGDRAIDDMLAAARAVVHEAAPGE